MVRRVARIEVPPLTAVERERWRIALDEAKRFSEELLAKRGGKLFEPSSEDIAVSRGERERELE